MVCGSSARGPARRPSSRRSPRRGRCRSTASGGPGDAPRLSGTPSRARGRRPARSRRCGRGVAHDDPEPIGRRGRRRARSTARRRRRPASSPARVRRSPPVDLELGRGPALGTSIHSARPSGSTPTSAAGHDARRRPVHRPGRPLERHRRRAARSTTGRPAASTRAGVTKPDGRVVAGRPGGDVGAGAARRGPARRGRVDAAQVTAEQRVELAVVGRRVVVAVPPEPVAAFGGQHRVEGLARAPSAGSAGRRGVEPLARACAAGSQARRSSRWPIQMPKSALIHDPAKIDGSGSRGARGGLGHRAPGRCRARRPRRR